MYISSNINVHNIIYIFLMRVYVNVYSFKYRIVFTEN